MVWKQGMCGRRWTINPELYVNIYCWNVTLENKMYPNNFLYCSIHFAVYFYTYNIYLGMDSIDSIYQKNKRKNPREM